jgi:disulfide bond formation protein DsbB
MFTFTQIVTTGTFTIHILLGIFLVVLCFAFLLKKRAILQTIKSEFQKKGIYVAWIFSTLATISPLIYSEVFHLVPCRFCWFQRIAMFPLFFVLSTSLLNKDPKGARRYGLPLAIAGSIVSTYHYLLQRGVTGGDSVACDVVGQGVSCSDMYIIEFGYITIPLMALTAFAMIIATLLMQKKK